MVCFREECVENPLLSDIWQQFGQWKAGMDENFTLRTVGTVLQISYYATPANWYRKQKNVSNQEYMNSIITNRLAI